MVSRHLERSDSGGSRHVQMAELMASGGQLVAGRPSSALSSMKKVLRLIRRAPVLGPAVMRP